MAIKNANQSILPDQVWADRQSGMEGRTVKVLAEETKSSNHVRVETLTPSAWSKSFDGGARAVGRRSTMHVNTLRKNYELIESPPEQPTPEQPTPERPRAEGEVVGYIGAVVRKTNGEDVAWINTGLVNSESAARIAITKLAPKLSPEGVTVLKVIR